MVFSDKLQKSRDQKSEGAEHVVEVARAGTGKTTTNIEGLKYLKGKQPAIDPSPQQQAIWDEMLKSKDAGSILAVAFNKSIATELQRRVEGLSGVTASTMHSMGMKVVDRAFGGVNRTGASPKYRVLDIISEITGRDLRELRRYKMEVLTATEKLVGLCKMNLVEPSYENLMELATYYDVDLNGSYSEVFSLTEKVIERSKRVDLDRRCDFNDMIWLPVVLDLPVYKHDLVLVDEAQDLNRCQQELAKKAGHRLFLCGDPKQAIYGFAGADAESIPRMVKMLSETNRGCKELPLTVTYRCGKAIVQEVQGLVPDFEAHETNPEGIISEASYKGGKNCYVNRVEDGDMILCRVNAPLVSQCFRFLKQGRKANIQGRDVGRGLISTVRKLKADNIADLASKLEDWHQQQVNKVLACKVPNEDKLIALQDRVDCLQAFMEDANTVEEVITKIEAVFTDDKDKPGIKLSSVHKAKGLESSRVFLLLPEGAGIPHPMARTKWAVEQEFNLKYVAITRAINELCYVR